MNEYEDKSNNKLRVTRKGNSTVLDGVSTTNTLRFTSKKEQETIGIVVDFLPIFLFSITKPTSCVSLQPDPISLWRRIVLFQCVVAVVHVRGKRLRRSLDWDGGTP